MKSKDSARWGEILLPKWKPIKWTWKRWLLLVFAISVFADSFVVTRFADERAEGVLFLILAFRAAAHVDWNHGFSAGGGAILLLVGASLNVSVTGGN